MHEAPAQQSENRFLVALSHNVYQRLLPHLKLVHLNHGKIIYEMGERLSMSIFLSNP
jgi:hypothetical protein